MGRVVTCYPVFEVVTCGECGQDYLSAQETFSGDTGEQKLNPYLEETSVDEFQLEVDPDEEDSADDSPSASSTMRRLICGHDLDPAHIEEWCLDKSRTLREHGDGIRVHLSPLDTGSMACPRCSAKDGRSRLFRELRIGAPFALSTIVPTALEHTPPMRSTTGKPRAGLPSQGKRLLGFSDSRQGSARLAVRLQQEAERNRVRSILYHALAVERKAAERKNVDTSELESQIDAMRGIPELRSLLEQQKAELARARAGSGLGTLSWKEAAERLTDDASSVRMRQYFRRTTYIPSTPEEFANFCLYREFFRRPKRMNSAETMGLVSLRYPTLEGKTPPPGWPLRREDWSVFLKLAIDFFVRDASAVNVDDQYLRWMGIPIRKRYVQGPDYEYGLTSRQRRWPSARPTSRLSRLPRLLREAAKLDDSPGSRDRIDEALRHAWNALQAYLLPVGDGYLLKLEEVAVLSELPCGYVCPYTTRVLDATLSGLSPYQTERGERLECQRFDPPRVPKAYWRDSSGREASREEIVEWLEHDPDVRRARKLGVWSNLNDRIVANTPYFETAEHSAQLDGTRLRGLEQRFKDGELNVLSCSTTMEMGVDIGGLSAVVMNNTPPSSTNYLQRAGRAGRRGEGVSFAVTLCPNSPHGEQVFNDPLWPFKSKMSIPRVALDSERLVQRHVNSLCLGVFLEGRDVRRLKTGWFFQNDEASGSIPGRQYIEWCRTEAEKDERLIQGLRRLVRRTSLVAVERIRLLHASADALAESMDAWRREADALRQDADQFRDGSGETHAPAVLAIERQLRRLEDEYLLRELANRQFLPSYGFPIGIVSFVPLTMEELKRRSSERDEREEAPGKRLGYPSRQMEMAIREYAPGAEVVMDGRVYKSGGVTLNWHVPPGEESIREVQALRHVWLCRNCGATGDTLSPPDQCPQCDGSVVPRKYLEPAGFAVDIRHSPHNNVVSPAYIPVEPPWISCPAPEWTPLADPCTGRFRYTDAGHLFHGSGGIHRHGYAVCLRCGRAASELGRALETTPPEVFRSEHPRLRGGKRQDGSSRCDGAGFAIQRGLWLGGSRNTDVFELQLAGLDEETTALSLGIALRRAFCRRLGIEEEEVGVTARPSKAADDAIQQSIFLYDAATGGNGYVAALRDHVVLALREVVRILDCPKKCDAACHGCLLTFDTQYDSTRLDRHKARAFLTDERLTGLDLKDHDRLLGPDSRVLTCPLSRHLAEVAGEPSVEEVRLWLGGSPDSWDVEDFPLYRNIRQWADDERSIRLFISPATWSGLSKGSRHSLAALVAAERGRVEVHCAPAPVAELTGSTVVAVAGGATEYVAWAMCDESVVTMNDSWGQAPKGRPCVYARIRGALPRVQADAISIDELRPQPDRTVAILPVQREFDGRLEGFGSRFWAKVGGHCHSLKEQFEQGGVLTRVSYRDRYLATPWSLLLLREALLQLVREGWADSGTAFHLLTRELRRDRRPNRDERSINDPWRDNAARRAFFEQAVDMGRRRIRWKGPFKFESGSAPHFRELRIEWSDGSLWTLKLDQGFGYWRCRPFAVFPFEENSREQVRAVDEIIKTRKIVAVGCYPTYIYVAKER